LSCRLRHHGLIFLLLAAWLIMCVGDGDTDARLMLLRIKSVSG